jgi:hypothetical protein
LPRSIHDLAIRTVDRIKDRAAVIGIAFFLLGILGSIKSDWCLLAALVTAFGRSYELASFG